MQEIPTEYLSKDFLSRSLSFIPPFAMPVLPNVFMTAVTLRHKIGFPTEPIHNFSH